MIDTRKLVQAVLLGVVLAVAETATACKPRFYHVEEYARSIPDHAIFQGRVVSVVDGNIRFSVTRWLGGDRLATPVIREVINSAAGTDCMGINDFTAKPGEEWLIFGRVREGVVEPERSLSLKLLDGKIPPDILNELKRAK